MKYKLIAFDLDGTLLHDDKTIAARSLRVLQAAFEAGAQIVPATGRIYKVIPTALKLQPFSRYFITVNGAYVYDAQADAALYRAEIGNELAIRLMEYMDTLDVLYDCYKDNWGFVSQYFLDHAGEYITDKGILEMFRRSRTPVEDLKDYLAQAPAGAAARPLPGDRGEYLDPDEYRAEHRRGQQGRRPACPV